MAADQAPPAHGTTIPSDYVTRNVIDPRGVVRVIRDNWWWCVNGDPTKAVFYIGRIGRRNRVGSPQCNPHRSICERIVPKLDDVQLVHLPVAFAIHEE